MIEADDFLNPAKALGYDFYCGVPCSFLTPFINTTITSPTLDYVAATSEGEAVAIAAGAWLAGRKTVVMCQNSGLGNAVNPLTSLNYPFQIPTLLITTLRGAPGLADEPQHELMGRITHQMLDVMEIPHADFPSDKRDIEKALNTADQSMQKSGLPYAFTMAKGSVADGTGQPQASRSLPAGRIHDFTDASPLPSRMAALERLLAHAPQSAALIATTGKSGRELFTLADRPQHLYQVGSMGCAAAMGLGVALNTPRKTIVIDGDGALLMKMGSLATIGSCAPENLIHVVMDNASYDSTGGQPTVSPGVDFAQIAASCGYLHGYTCNALSGFEKALTQALSRPGPHLVHLKIAPGSARNLGRPTVKPPAVARRFRDFLASKPANDQSN
ncbi:MAG: phosphonopyruvate decarboxylase [Rhodospirillales bacterium]|nr:phosphonopyruvate decarboxylase [Rhodospirillales bacterium]